MSQFLASHGEPVLFLAIFAEQMGLPLPAAPLLVATGALAANGAFSPTLGLGVTLAACVLADLIWYYLGRRGGNRLLQFLCKLVLGDPSHVGRTERVFARYGMSAVAAAKFVPGLGVLIPPLAGAFRIGLGKFLWFDLLGSLLYGTFYLVLGLLFTNEVNSVLDLLSELGLRTVALALALVAILVGYKYAQRRKAVKPAAELSSRPLAAIPGT